MKIRVLITIVVVAGSMLIASCSSSGSSSTSSTSNSSSSSSSGKASPVAAVVTAPTPTPTKAPTAGAVIVQVDMSDKKIGFESTTFKTGTVYNFSIRNKGQFTHNFAIVPKGEKDAANALFKIEQIEVGKTIGGEYTFTKAGEFDIISAMPGDLDAGMKTAISVQ